MKNADQTGRKRDRVSTWSGLPPFAFGRIQDRGNGENLCRPHPETGH